MLRSGRLKIDGASKQVESVHDKTAGVLDSLLEQEDVWFRLMNLIVFPSKTLYKQDVRFSFPVRDGVSSNLRYSKSPPFLFP